MIELSQRRRNILICLCLALVTTVVYWPVCHFEFVSFDDSLYITENPHLRDGLTLRGLRWALTTPLDQWMPVTWVVRILEYQWFGLNGNSHHLVNVLFHIANTLLLFSVLNRMTRARGEEHSRRAATWRSALVAALFALHPLHVESVAWVTGLKDVLSTCFWLLTIWAYVRYTEQFTVHSSQFSVHGVHPESLRRKSPIAHRSSLIAFYALALLFFTLGLMSKPMVVTLPFVMLLLDYWPLGRTRWAPTLVSGAAVDQTAKRSAGQLLTEKLPFFGLAVVSCAVTFWAQHGAAMVVPLEKLPLEMRIANVALAYVNYVGQTFWPTELSVFYPLDMNLSLAAALVAAVGLVGVTAAVIWGASRRPWLVTGWFWYLGTLVPVIGFVQVGNQSMADRYTYVPLVGLFMMLGWSVPGRAIERRNFKVITCIATGAVLIVCAMLSRIQVCYWKDTETLFRHALDVTRDNWLAHNNLGAALGLAGKTQEAIKHYEEALRIKPHYPNARYNLGITLEQTGRVREAIACYEQALQTNPDYAEAHNNLGSALARLGRIQEAIAHWERALKINPDYTESHYNLGVALAKAGRVPEAIEHYEHVLRIKPDYADAHHNLGNALIQAGKPQEAIAHWEEALRLKPDYAEAHNNLGLALEQLGKLEDAIAHYEQAVRLKPDYAKAYFNLGIALEKAGRVTEAIAHYEQALRIQPGMTAAQNRLARLRAGQ